MTSDGSNNPYVAYVNFNADSVRLASKTAGKWSYQRVSDTADQFGPLSIGVWSSVGQRRPQIAFNHFDNSSSDVLLATGTASCCGSASLTTPHTESFETSSYFVRAPSVSGTSGSVEFIVGLPAAEVVEISVHDIAGRRVGRIGPVSLAGGIQRVNGSVGRLPSGMYSLSLRGSTGVHATGRWLVVH
jgi:hypothetical protein